MMVRVELDGRLYRVELFWGPISGCEGGRHMWWLRSVNGETRPAGRHVLELYRRAVEMAEQVAASIRRERAQ